MKRRSSGVALVSMALLTACGGAAEEPPAPTEEGSPPQTAAGGSPGSAVLVAMVGTQDDPEAFEISLTTEDGEPVEEVPAGDYTIQVTDPATLHNFHLTGGSVDESTSVPDTEEVVWEVTLEEGEYTFRCDPHPSMSGSFAVTA